MRTILQAIRWSMVPVSAITVVAACTFAARWAVTLADRYCAPGNLIGGSCVEPWHTTAVEAIAYAAMIIGALGFVLVPAVVAPLFQRVVGVTAFCLAIGIAVNAYALTSWPELRVPLVAITLSSATGLWWVWSRRIAREA